MASVTYMTDFVIDVTKQCLDAFDSDNDVEINISKSMGAEAGYNEVWYGLKGLYTQFNYCYLEYPTIANRGFPSGYGREYGLWLLATHEAAHTIHWQALRRNNKDWDRTKTGKRKTHGAQYMRFLTLVRETVPFSDIAKQYGLSPNQADYINDLPEFIPKHNAVSSEVRAAARTYVKSLKSMKEEANVATRNEAKFVTTFKKVVS